MNVCCRAISYDKLGDFASSIRDYSAVIALEPENVNAYYSMSHAHAASSRSTALTDCSQAFDTFFRFAGRGFALDNMGQGEAASLDYRQALEIEESSAKNAPAEEL